MIAGAGEERHKLIELGDSLGLGDSLYFVGQLSREAVFSALKGFDIVVVPSREEGFGLSAIEAMACGVPLVSSDAGALPEVTGNGENSVIFESSNADDLFRGLMRLLDSETLRLQLSAKAAQHVYAAYSQTNFVAAVKNLIYSID